MLPWINSERQGLKKIGQSVVVYDGRAICKWANIQIITREFIDFAAAGIQDHIYMYIYIVCNLQWNIRIW